MFQTPNLESIALTKVISNEKLNPKDNLNKNNCSKPDYRQYNGAEENKSRVSDPMALDTQISQNNAGKVNQSIYDNLRTATDLLSANDSLPAGKQQNLISERKLKLLYSRHCSMVPHTISNSDVFTKLPQLSRTHTIESSQNAIEQDAKLQCKESDSGLSLKQANLMAQNNYQHSSVHSLEDRYVTSSSEKNKFEFTDLNENVLANSVKQVNGTSQDVVPVESQTSGTKDRHGDSDLSSNAEPPCVYNVSPIFVAELGNEAAASEQSLNTLEDNIVNDSYTKSTGYIIPETTSEERKLNDRNPWDNINWYFANGMMYFFNSQLHSDPSYSDFQVPSIPMEDEFYTYMHSSQQNTRYDTCCGHYIPYYSENEYLPMNTYEIDMPDSRMKSISLGNMQPINERNRTHKTRSNRYFKPNSHLMKRLSSYHVMEEELIVPENIGADAAYEQMGQRMSWRRTVYVNRETEAQANRVQPRRYRNGKHVRGTMTSQSIPSFSYTNMKPHFSFSSSNEYFHQSRVYGQCFK